MHQPATILVVEDEDLIRRLITEALEGGGYRVIAVCDPLEALAMVAERRSGIDLLVTDVVMPRMNGCELAHILRSRVDRMNVVFISGYVPDMGQEILRKGDAFLQKPFRPSALTQLVREMVDPPPSVRSQPSGTAILSSETDAERA